MLLVRHSVPEIDPAVPPEEWVLSAEGRARRRTVGWLQPRELERGIRTLFERPDEVVFGEESAAAALERFTAAIEGLPDSAVVVSHGTVSSLFVSAQTGLDAYEVWQGLQLPDLVEI